MESPVRDAWFVRPASSDGDVFSSALVPPNGLPTFGERAIPFSVADCKVRVLCLPLRVVVGPFADMPPFLGGAFDLGFPKELLEARRLLAPRCYASLSQQRHNLGPLEQHGCIILLVVEIDWHYSCVFSSIILGRA
jgi:hypothetical protein